MHTVIPSDHNWKVVFILPNGAHQHVSRHADFQAAAQTANHLNGGLGIAIEDIQIVVSHIKAQIEGERQ